MTETSDNQDELVDGIQKTFTWQANQVTSRPDANFARSFADGETPGGRSRTYKVFIAVSAAACLLAGLGYGVSRIGNDESTTEDVAASNPAAGGQTYDWATASSDSGGNNNCIADANPSTIRQREFALDGTVIKIVRTDSASEDSGGSLGATVQVQVNEWFAGGSAPTVEITLQRAASAHDRLLIAGQGRTDDPGAELVAWECGFTTKYSQAARDAWASATSSN